MPNPSRSSSTRPIATEPGVRLGTLLEDLLWPRLFEAVPLALKPERLIYALLTIVLLSLVGGANTLWGADEPFLPVALAKAGAQLNEITTGLITSDYESARFGVERLTTTLPKGAVVNHTASVLILGPLLILIWGIGGVAISRSGACEFAMGICLPWPRTFAFALERWKTILATYLSPWLIIGFLAAMLRLMGVLMGVPYLGVAAAVLFGLFLFIAALAVILMFGYILGFILLVPAISCEGTDAIDAMQRTYARVLGRPFRLLLYMLIAGAIGVVAISAVSLFMDAVRSVAIELAGDPMSHPDSPVATIFGFWMNLLTLLVASYALSYFHVASTAVYLVLRQVADTQDIADLWMPGMVEGTMTESLKARGEVARKL